MPHAFQIHKQDAPYFLTLTAIEWLDAFMRKEHKMILCDSLNYCIEHKGLEVFAYAIMTSHVHLLAQARNGDLSAVMRDFKKFTSYKLIKEFQVGTESRRDWMMELIKKGGEKQKKKSDNQLWQYNNHAEEIISPRFILSKIKYIHQNPVEAGLVDRAIDYPFCSAKDYAGEKSFVNVTLLNLHSLM